MLSHVVTLYRYARFVSVDGVPLSRFTMDAKGGVAHHGADKLCADATKTFADFARACELFADLHNRQRRAAAGAGHANASPPSPPLRHVAVARYPAPHASRKLTAKQLRACLAALDARRLGRAMQPPPHPGAEFLPPPYCIQAHIPARRDGRYVTSFMWADTAVVCDTTSMSHAAMYEPLPSTPPDDEDAPEVEEDGLYGGSSRGSGLGITSGGGGGGLGNTSTELELTLRQQTLRVVSHVATAHASQLLGLVLEYVVDARTDQPYLNAVLATCW